jgi:hypothetical protein
MKRTQIYLPNQMHQELLSEAKKHDLTLSEVIRQRILKSKNDKNVPTKSAVQLFEELAERGKKLDWKDSPENLSEMVDEIIYG